MKILFNSVREIGPIDRNGASSFAIGERETLAHEGDAISCAAFLEATPVGRSVTVRHAGGIRSCMNKPSLWADVLEYRA